MNRAEVLEHIAPLTDRSVRKVDHAPHTKVVVAPDQVAFRAGRGSNLLTLNKEGLRSLESYTGVPVAFEKALSPDTFSRVTTEILAKKGTYDLITREGEVIAFENHQAYRNLNAERVLKAVEGGITGDVDYHRTLMLPNNTVSLEILGHNQERVTGKDMIRAGALVQFSPIGTTMPLVQSFVCRLICTNGMTSTDVLREFAFGGGGGGGEGDDVWQWFRQSTRDAYNSVARVCERFRVMKGERLNAADIPMLLAELKRQAGITKGSKVDDAINAMAIEQAPRNSYDLTNIITYATSHLMDNPVHVRRAQNAVAVFADQESHARTCPVCRRQQLN